MFGGVATTTVTLSAPLGPIIENVFAFVHEMCSAEEPRGWFDDFKFGLSPILNWLSIIGINLKQNQPKKRKFLYQLYDAVLLLNSVLFVLIYNVDYGINPANVWMEEKRKTRSSSIILLLDIVLYSFKGVGTQLLLSFQTKTRWLDLWRSLQNLRRFKTLDSEAKLHRLTVTGLIYAIISVELLMQHYRIDYFQSSSSIFVS